MVYFCSWWNHEKDHQDIFDLGMNDLKKTTRHGRSLDRFRSQRQGGSARKRWIVGTLVSLFAVGLLWFGVTVASAFQKVSDTSDRSSPLLRLFGQEVTPDQLQGEGDGRINVLLIGIGGVNHKGGLLADTVMVGSFDVENNQLALLSLPRDLRVPIAGNGYGKLNSAHSYGETQERGSGPKVLKETVSDILDLPIHYYVRVDFAGFEEFIDAIGGIDIEVPKALNDPFYPDPRLEGYEPFYLAAGQQHLDGAKALKYARSRQTTSDFDRAARQQQIILAAREKATSLGIVANPLKVAELIQIVGDHVKTDIGTSELSRLASLGNDLQSEDVITKVLDNSPDGPLKSVNDGGYYLVPKAGDFSEVQRIAYELFSDPYLRREQAKIEILNGTGNAGQALELQQDLEALGYTIVSIDKTDPTATTKLYDYSGDKAPFTAKFLGDRLQTQVAKSARPADAAGIDIRVILGENYLELEKR